MAYDEELDARVAAVVSGWGTERKRMFGGTGYLLNGNLLAGVHRDRLVLRLGEEAGSAALAAGSVVPFDITGRPMTGWVMVEQAALGEDELMGWLDAAKRFVETLPPKG